MLRYIKNWLMPNPELLRKEALMSAVEYFRGTPRHLITHEQWHAYQRSYMNAYRNAYATNRK